MRPWPPYPVLLYSSPELWSFEHSRPAFSHKILLRSLQNLQILFLLSYHTLQFHAQAVLAIKFKTEKAT